MITVRFPTGFSIQYNDIDHADFRTNGVYLGKKSAPNTYSVWAPLDCVIEHISPCRTYNAAGPTLELEQEVRLLQKKVESLQRAINKKKL